MLKRVISILLSALLLFSLVGCSGGGDDVLKSSTKNGEKQKINFWTHNTNEKELQLKLIEEYNVQNPEVEIVVNMIGDKYGDVLNMAMSSNEAPDIYSVQGPSLTKKSANLGWAEPLDSYMTPEFKGKFDERAWTKNNNVIDGKIYTLPDQMSTYRMVYNKDLFKKAGLNPNEPPKTFDEFREVAKKITATGVDTKGYILALGDSYQLDVSVFNGIGNYSLGTLSGYDYSKGAFDYSVFKSTIELFKNMRKDGSILEGELLLKPDQARVKFAEGGIGMMGSASWETTTFAELNLPFEMGVCNWPTIDGKPRGKNTIQMGSGFAMSSKTKNKELTWKALEFIASENFTGKINAKSGAMGLLVDKNETKEYANKYVQYFIPGADDGMWPAVVPSLKLQGDNRSVVFTRLITQDDVDIDAELADLTKRSNEAFDKAINAKEFVKSDYKIDGFNPLDL